MTTNDGHLALADEPAMVVSDSTDADSAPTDDGEPTSGSTVMGRRGLLGALAAGVVLAACGTEAENSLTTLPPGSAPPSSTPPGGGAVTTSPTLPPSGLAADLVEVASGASSANVVQVAPAGSGGNLSDLSLPSIDGGTTATAEAAAAAPAAPATPTAPAAPASPSTTSGGAASPPPSAAPGPPVLQDPSSASTPTSTPSTPPTSTPSSTATSTPSSTATNPVSTPATPVPSNGTSAGVETVISKLTFGPTPGLVAEVTAMGPEAFVADQLRRTSADSSVERQLSGFNYVGLSPLQAKEKNGSTGSRNLIDEFNHAGVVRAVHSRSQLFEMMCHLWMDHFNINLSSNHVLWPAYEAKVIRANAMGSFRDLLVASAHAPGMLHYLNNDVSNAADALKVNENYGRELLELHTLGIGPRGQQIYTQTDVEEAALAMSGWSADLDRDSRRYGSFTFRDDYAYTGEVTLLNGAWTSAGLSGKARGDSLLEFLVTHPTTAGHVAYKICRRFVSDAPSDALVASAAQVYLDNDTEIVPVLAHVFASDEFGASHGHKIRRPLEHLAACIRATGSGLPLARSTRLANTVRYYSDKTGHKLWTWEQPDGFPDYAEHWISAESFLARWNFAGNLARGKFRSLPADIDTVRPAGAGTAGELVAALARQLGLGVLGSEAIQSTLAAVETSVDDPADDVSAPDFRTILGLLMANPLFQIR